jgi:hypothetical protein
MNSTISPEAAPSATHRAPGGLFAKGNSGGPGNPFARQTAALRAALINAVTERDIQDIVDVLLLNAKGGNLPNIKLLFSYVLGKPKPVVEPDLLDLQEMQMLQQGALPAEALETLCAQLPLDLQVQLTRFTQTQNATTVVQTALGNAAPCAPSTTGNHGETHDPPAGQTPSTNEVFGEPCVPTPIPASSTTDDYRSKPQKPPSANGKSQRPPKPPKRVGFDWLAELRRPSAGRAKT